jgi:flagellar biosynthesis/type III secretory pathway ATPase
MTAEFFFEMWSIVSSYIPPKERMDAARQVVTLYDEFNEIEDLNNIEGSDKYLDRAINEKLHDEEY